MRVLNFGSLNLDYVYQVDHFVRPGETLSSTSRAVKLGGKGLNQSIALARAGANVSHAGCIGAGGEALRAQLERDGVDVSMLLSVDEMQGHTVIQVNR
ncbi:MAG: ribokinase, partial [Clostridia bacterium]|nr:ribokinase [Clostridia bacterium]